MNPFDAICVELLSLLDEWEGKLLSYPPDLISDRRNHQNRTIRQILGHLIDSATNNIHRIVHLQYQPTPCSYPNYATHGNNDRWIAIQNYQEESWADMMQLWKYLNRHIVHVIGHVDPSKLEHQWRYDENRLITLKEGIIDYLRHFKLHLDEIDQLAKQ